MVGWTVGHQSRTRTPPRGFGSSITEGRGHTSSSPNARVLRGGPAWSADGNRLAFTELGAVEKIYVTDAIGTTPVLLETACPTECDDNAPSFSPDGTRIAFRRVLFGSGRSDAPTSTVIATMDLATGTVEELPSTETPFADDGLVNEYPRWSPDGTQLLFYRWTIGSDGVPTASALFVVDCRWQESPGDRDTALRGRCRMVTRRLPDRLRHVSMARRSHGGRAGPNPERLYGPTRWHRSRPADD